MRNKKTIYNCSIYKQKRHPGLACPPKRSEGWNPGSRSHHNDLQILNQIQYDFYTIFMAHKHSFLLLTLLLLFLTPLFSGTSEDYYNGSEGKKGTELQSILHNIIDDHTVRSYTNLWTDMQSTDKKANGKVWDMYSDNPGGTPPYEFTFGTDQDVGTGGSTEGEFYNREHSFPKSWFDDGSPMYTDLFHLYPTDKLVNNKRGNYPYGEIDNASWTSLNGSKVGSCSYPGYSGTVFEPIDAYKGDFARTYFYMATRYYGDDGDWPGSDMTNGAQMKPWALAMMREWDKNDPVSEKELNRNNAVYTIQKNRNPFIDYPWFSGLIWGNLAPAPTNLRLENESTCSPKLVWDDVSDNETGFLIYNHDSLFANVPADSASCLLSGFYSGDTLILYVTSQTSEGEAPSDVLEIILPDSCSNPNAISQENTSIPAAFILHQNFPNPFNASTIFQFENLIKQELSLIIYDSNGKVVFEKYFADLAPGMHQFQWNPKELTSGIYFYQFTAGKIHCSGKSLLIK